MQIIERVFLLQRVDIFAAAASQHLARIALGIGVLCLYVLAFNRRVWRRLYDLAAERLRLD